MITFVGICYRNYTRYTLYRSFLPISGMAIIRSLSFLFLYDFEGNANISVAIKSGSTFPGGSRGAALQPYRLYDRKER